MLETIKSMSLQYRKDKHELSGTLVSLLSDIMLKGKNSKPPRQANDLDAIEVLKKYLEIAKSNHALVPEESKFIQEIELFSGLLPRQLSEVELKDLIEKTIEDKSLDLNPKNIGILMKFLKENHNGQYDSQLAKNIIEHTLKEHAI